MRKLFVTVIALFATSIVAVPQVAVAEGSTPSEDCTVEISRMQAELDARDSAYTALLREYDAVALKARRLEGKVERKNHRIARLERLVRKLRSDR